jgi:hypothetical protein
MRTQPNSGKVKPTSITLLILITIKKGYNFVALKHYSATLEICQPIRKVNYRMFMLHMIQ